MLNRGARGARWKLIAATVGFALGVDLATPTSRPLMAFSAVLTVGSVVAFLRTLVLSGRKEGVLYRNRREIGLAAVSTVIALALAVSAAAALRLGPRRFALNNQRYDAELGWAPPDVPDVVGQRQQKVHHGRPHVVMMGDSILYGLGVGDDETAAAQLQRYYPDEEVLNLAVSGYSIDQYYIYLRRVLPALDPKLVVVGLFTGNDFQVTAQEFSWGHTKPLFSLQGDKLVPLRADLLADNCIDHLAQSLLFRVAWSKKELAQDLIQVFCQPRTLRLLEHERLIAKLFDEIEALGRARGAPTLFLLLPTRHMGNPFDDINFNYILKYRNLRALLQSGHHEYFELYPEIVRAEGPEDAFFIDGGHLTVRGQTLLADSLHRYLAEKHPELR